MVNKFEETLYSYMINANPIRRSIAKGEVLYLEGMECLEVSYLIKGEIHAINVYPDGKEALFKVINEKEFIGPLLILATNPYYKASFKAASNLELLTISKDSFKHFISNNNDLMITYLADNYNKSADSLKFKQYKTLKQQLCHLFYTWSNHGKLTTFRMKLTATEIASFLLVSRVSVSRIIQKMREDSLITKDKRYITVLNWPVLLSFL